MWEIFKVFSALIIPFMTGVLAVTILTKNFTSRSAALILFGGLGTGLGFSSLIYFLSLVFHIPIVLELFVELLIASALIIVLRRTYISQRKKIGDHDVTPDAGKRRNWSLMFLTCCLGLLIINTSMYYLVRSFQYPHGGGDAYHFWNLKARFLYRTDLDHWRNIFSEIIGAHRDYPLLVPGFIARTWTIIGSDTFYVPIYTHFIFALATAGLLFGAVFFFRSVFQAFLAAAFLLSTPFFIKTGNDQFADLPLSFFFLSSIVFLLAAYSAGETRVKGNLILAGLSAGLSMWTKNEGILFFFVCAIGLALNYVRFRDSTEGKGHVLFFLGGASPAIAVLLYFKAFLVPVNDLVAAQGADSWHRMADPSRYLMVAQAFVNKSWSFGNWWITPIPLGLVYVGMVGIKWTEYKRGIALGCFILLMMLTGYFFIYVNTFWDLTWHLNTSLDRLFLQLLPSVIFLYFMIAKTPEEYLGLK